MIPSSHAGNEFVIEPVTVRPTAAPIVARRFVNWDGEQYDDGTGAEAALGVSAHAIAQDTLGQVTRQGTALVEAGAAIAAKSLVTAGADGRAVTTANTALALGRAESAATDAGELVKVFLLPR